MSDLLAFVLARYNYWIVIVLMMTGLYIVFSRGNLVKTVVGLNIFQTSVFIFYITLGKVAGGTAPILVGGHGEEDHGEGHGDGHDAPHDTSHAGPHGADHGAALTPEEAAAYALEGRANEAGALARADLPSTPNLDGLHDASIGANALTPGGAAPAIAAPSVEVAVMGAHGEAVIASDQAPSAEHAADAALDILYSNPLPHVLILTAIVVGVATTAVGLAIAVRIREAYGTVEEDALERMDNEAAGYVAADEAGATPG